MNKPVTLVDKIRACLRAQKCARRNYKKHEELLLELANDPKARKFVKISNKRAVRVADLSRGKPIIWKSARFCRYELEVKSL
jgi:2-keto-4-pentenoate hydratase/2-oxohepta-3-ene-1,7-dioic acid hydratase in catechol pathway